MKKKLILVLGGARSGKSAFAQQLAQQKAEAVLFIATAEAGDSEMMERVEHHRMSRPERWDTVEEPLKLVQAIEGATQHGVILVDCLTLWVSNLLQANGELNQAGLEVSILDATREMLRAYEKGKATLILVSNEVGMGLVPPYPLGRNFRDILGKVNQLVSLQANQVYLMVAGLAVDLLSLGSTQVLNGGDQSVHPDGSA